MTKVEILFLNFAALSLVCCVGAPSRAPNSAEESFDKNTASHVNNEFLRSLIPAALRLSFPFDANTVLELENDCKKSALSIWLREMNNPEELAARDAVVLEKLNRPFYFTLIDNGSEPAHSIGKKEDFNDLSCLALVIRDGKIDGPVHVSGDFIHRGTNLPNLNFQGLHFLLAAWRDGVQSTADALLILQHPKLIDNDVALLDVEIFNPFFPAEKRLPILKSLFDSPVYRKNGSLIRSDLKDKVRHLMTAADLEPVIRLFIQVDPVHFPTDTLFDLILSRADQDFDATKLYFDFFRDRNSFVKTSALMRTFRSNAQIQNAEMELLAIWNSNPDDESMKMIFAYAFDRSVAQKRISLKTSSQILLSGTVRFDGDTQMTISLLHSLFEKEPYDLLTRLALFQKICSFKNMDSAVATTVLFDASSFLVLDGLVPTGLNECVFSVQKRFSNDPAVMDKYIFYLLRLRDERLLLDLAETYLVWPELDPSFLEMVAKATLRQRTESSEIILKRLLSHRSVTKRVLQQVSLKMMGFITRTTPLEREILDLIDANSLTTQEMKEINARNREDGH